MATLVRPGGQITDGKLAEDASHEVTLDPEDPHLVVKRYLPTTHRAPQREWRALRLLQKYAPGLSPEPVHADLSADPPVVVMSRLGGEPMRGRPLAAERLDALGAALERLHGCVPAGVLGRMGRAGNDDAATAGAKLRRQLASLPEPGEDAVVSAAFDYARTWLESPEATGLARFDGPAVFARADHNLANFLLDDDHVVLVDFEYSGRGDRPGELAELVEHISARTTPDGEWETFLFALRTQCTRAPPNGGPPPYERDLVAPHPPAWPAGPRSKSARYIAQPG